MITATEVQYEYAIKVALIQDETQSCWVEMTSYTDLDDVIGWIKEEIEGLEKLTEDNFWDLMHVVLTQGYPDSLEVIDWSIEKLARFIELVEDEGVNSEAFTYFYNELHHSTDLDDVYKSFQDAFIGIFKNENEFIEYYLEMYHPELEKIKLVDSSLSSFLDYDSIYTALDNSGDYNIENNYHNQLMIFNSRW